MNRRTFLANWTALAALTPLEGGAREVQVTIDPRRKLGAIPADFAGLGYEISSIAIDGLLSSRNQTYQQLVRTLSRQGVIRIGGNTSDDASFQSAGKSVSSPKGTVINTNDLSELGTFLRATGWRLIWGLNLGSGDEQKAAVEAQAVAAAVQDRLLAFEIGNEPDLFARGTAHRPTSYDYSEYLSDFRRYRAAIRAKLPNAPFAGPDVASATEWVSRFAADEGRGLKLLTHHYYRECAQPSSTLDKLLYPDQKLAPLLAKLRAASGELNVPYRICETNSFCGGGKPGVSDTFGAALWVLDFMFNLASAHCAGLNLETGVNQLGFVSSYSPIAEEHGAYVAKPPYYGMLAFAQASPGQRLAIDLDAAGLNASAFAVLSNRKLSLVFINKDSSFDADVSVAFPAHLDRPRAIRLAASSLEAREAVTLGGSAVSLDGKWTPNRVEPVPAKNGRCEISVPAGSAVILSLSRL